MKNINLYKAFKQKNRYNTAANSLSNTIHQLSSKQLFCLIFIPICSILVTAQVPVSILTSVLQNAASSSQSVPELINDSGEMATEFVNSFTLVGVIKSLLDYIVKVQIESIEFIASTPMGGAGIFDKITSGLTIFAAIACFIKLITHYLNTERFDNVKAFTGFFSYVSIFILFLFSGAIVKQVSHLNSNINTTNIVNVKNILMKEVDESVKKDWEQVKKKYDDLNEQAAATVNPATLTGIYFEKVMLPIKFTFSKFVFYIYMCIFSTLLMCSLAIPAVTMTIMVKVTLSIMLLGAKLVFLLAFIPGFENVWKTYMMNLINVLLWIPIFNVIISFIITFVSNFITNDSIGTGQVIWLSIVTLIFASQSISLTTTTANMIVSGAGSGIAGAMGSLTSMSATSVVAGGAAAAGGIAVMAASGGSSAASSAAAGAAANKFTK